MILMDNKEDIDIVNFAEQYLGIHLFDYQKKILREFMYSDCDIAMSYKMGYTMAKGQRVLAKIILDTMKG